MIGRTQTLPWWLGGRGKDDRKQNTLALNEYLVYSINVEELLVADSARAILVPILRKSITFLKCVLNIFM